MTRSAALARIGLSSGRWLLPWIAVLFVSATLPYAMSGVVHGGAVASNQQPDIQGLVEPPPSSSSVDVSPATAALADGDDVRARFLASLHSQGARCLGGPSAKELRSSTLLKCLGPDHLVLPYKIPETMMS